MSPLTLSLLAALAVLCFWAVGAHNRLMRLRNAIGETFQRVETHLGARHDIMRRLAGLAESPTLVAASQQAAAALDLVRRQPASVAPVTSLALAEQVLQATLNRLTADTSPDLRNDWRPLLDELTANASALTFTRDLFNDAVHAYNQAVQQWPTRWLCPLLRFKLGATLPDEGAHTQEALALQPERP